MNGVEYRGHPPFEELAEVVCAKEKAKTGEDLFDTIDRLHSRVARLILGKEVQDALPFWFDVRKGVDYYVVYEDMVDELGGKQLELLAKFIYAWHDDKKVAEFCGVFVSPRERKEEVR